MSRRPLRAWVTTLALAAGLLVPLTVAAPAEAGQVTVSIGVQGAGFVRVVEGSIEDGGATTCDHTYNLDHRVTRTCTSIRNEEPLEAWVWLRPVTTYSPAGWEFSSWRGCDQTRERSGMLECGLGSPAFGSATRSPVAVFQDPVPPSLTELAATQLTEQEGTFRFTWKADGASSEQCRVGDEPFAACASGVTRTLPEGPHTFQVRAEDPSGNGSGVRQVEVRTVQTMMFTRPPELSSTRSAEFLFSSGEGATYNCTHNGFVIGCAEGVARLENLVDGRHTFTVRGRIGAWVDPVPNVWHWTVDATAPRTLLSGAPRSGTILTSRTVTLRLGSDDPQAQLSCTLNARPLGCTAGQQTLRALPSGTQLFAARASDLLGNVDAAGVSAHWTVPVAARGFARAKRWRLVRSAAAFDGAVLQAKRRGAATTVAVRNARSLALVATRGRRHGTVQVYAGSRLVKTVRLAASSTRTKQILPLTTFSSPWSGTVRIKVISTKRPVRLEGLAAPTR